MLFRSKEGKCIRFNENDVRATGRDTMGVRGMDIGADDVLVDMAVIKPDCEVITMTENGYGKRSDLEDYRLQSRSGKGIKAGVFTEKTGKLVSLKLVSEDEDLMIISENGTIIKVASSDISKIGRATQGVKVMRIEDSRVSRLAITPKSEEDDEDVEDTETQE